MKTSITLSISSKDGQDWMSNFVEFCNEENFDVKFEARNRLFMDCVERFALENNFQVKWTDNELHLIQEVIRLNNICDRLEIESNHLGY